MLQQILTPQQLQQLVQVSISEEGDWLVSNNKQLSGHPMYKGFVDAVAPGMPLPLSLNLYPVMSLGCFINEKAKRPKQNFFKKKEKYLNY